MDTKVFIAAFAAIMVAGALLSWGKKQTFSPGLATFIDYINDGYAKD